MRLLNIGFIFSSIIAKLIKEDVLASERISINKIVSLLAP
jgi:hypothetical protein